MSSQKTTVIFVYFWFNLLCHAKETLTSIFEFTGRSIKEANAFKPPRMQTLTASLFVCLGTLLTALLIVSLVLFPLQVAMIVIGAKYKDECPVQNLIPIYLIVSGAASLFANCCACGVRYKEGNQEETNVNPLQGIAQVFLFAWFICGNVWIYGNYEPNYNDPSSADFCNKTLYLFAFWATTAYYIVLGISMIISCGVGFFISVFASR